MHVGILKYSDELMARLRRDPHLEPGSELEIEIRGNSIWSVELLRRKMHEVQQRRGTDGLEILNAITIDFHLWDFAKAERSAMCDIPIHKTLSIYY